MSESVQIREGHRKTDVSCIHGSRWIWWFDDWKKDQKGYRGEWHQVVMVSICDCRDPPLPFRSVAEVEAYLAIQRKEQTTL